MIENDNYKRAHSVYTISEIGNAQWIIVEWSSLSLLTAVGQMMPATQLKSKGLYRKRPLFLFRYHSVWGRGQIIKTGRIDPNDAFSVYKHFKTQNNGTRVIGHLQCIFVEFEKRPATDEWITGNSLTTDQCSPYSKVLMQWVLIKKISFRVTASNFRAQTEFPHSHPSNGQCPPQSKWSHWPVSTFALN